MPRYLDPKSDFTFVKIFGEHKDLLRSFLNALLPIPEGEKILDLDYINPREAPVFSYTEQAILGVRCYTSLGNRFTVKIQIEWFARLLQRLVFDKDDSHLQRLQERDTSPLDKKIYGLILLAGKVSEGDEWRHSYRVIEEGGIDRREGKIELVFIEIPKYPSNPQQKDELTLWMRFLQINGGYQQEPTGFSWMEEASKAFGLLDENQYTSGEVNYYERYWDSIRLDTSFKEDYFQQGRNRWAEEKRIAEAQRQVYKELLSRGVSVQEIARVLNISQKEIEWSLESNESNLTA
jgi:predicted transposase/invertase (TIGR01784 family)